MAVRTEDILNSERFKKLVRTRWTVSTILLILLFILYYGYILVVAYGKSFLIQKLGPDTATNYGIIFGVGTIVGAWLLTVAYVVWANNVYDVEVKAIKDEFIK